MNLNKTVFYYKELGFNNIDTWSDGDLANFLIGDFISINEPYYPNTKNLVESRVLGLHERYHKHVLLKYIIDSYNVFIGLCKTPKKPKILFNIYVSNKYLPIIKESQKKYDTHILTWGIKDRIFAVKNFMTAEHFSNLGYFIHHYIITKNPTYLRDLMKTTLQELKKMNPDYIVVGFDALPIERVIILAAKILGIPTIEIQHGAYLSSLPLETGRMADYLLVWGQYYKDLYINQGLRTEVNTFVLGYPFFIKKMKHINIHKPYSICFLGENYEVYNNHLLKHQVGTINTIASICSKLKIDFVFRPHPKQDMKAFVALSQDVRFTNKQEKIEETFKNSDIFISFSSTSLVEASMRGKMSLQLMDFPLRLDNFEELGACSKSFKTMAELEEYLVKISYSPDLSQFRSTFNNKYVEILNNPGNRFLEILEEIKKR